MGITFKDAMHLIEVTMMKACDNEMERRKKSESADTEGITDKIVADATINQKEWDMLMELISCGRIAGIMAGSFEDKTHKGRVQKLDKKKLENFDTRLKKVIHKLALRCGLELKNVTKNVTDKSS